MSGLEAFIHYTSQPVTLIDVLILGGGLLLLYILREFVLVLVVCILVIVGIGVVLAGIASLPEPLIGLLVTAGGVIVMGGIAVSLLWAVHVVVTTHFKNWREDRDIEQYYADHLEDHLEDHHD